jgi:hypothetical protein
MYRQSAKCTPFERFMCNVQTGNECWIWLGYTQNSKMGYGYLRFNGKHVLAHRQSYKLFKGEIPSGMNICHTCDNPKCVRPSHLFAGTQSENMKDASIKGRLKASKETKEKQSQSAFKRWANQDNPHPRQKITAENRAEICSLYESGSITQAKLAEKFGVAQTHISRIVNGIW